MQHAVVLAYIANQNIEREHKTHIKIFGKKHAT